jgi:hypothetical protein
VLTGDDGSSEGTEATVTTSASLEDLETLG